MAAASDSERTFIGGVKHKKYGSTSRSCWKSDSTIRHEISPNDTLPGIALKYGVSIEELKRTNNLWSNEGFHLRTFLNIPVTYGNTFDPLPIDDKQVSDLQSGTVVNGVPSVNGSCSPQGSSSVYDKSEKSPDSLLQEIDSTIALARSRMSRLTSDSPFVSPEEDVLFMRSTSNRYYSVNHHLSDNVNPNDTRVLPWTVVKRNSSASSKKLQRKEEEDFFEL